MISMRVLYTILAIRKLDQLTKPTINLTTERKASAPINTNGRLGLSPIMSEIIKTTYSMYAIK
jgi:hypothetical protein